MKLSPRIPHYTYYYLTNIYISNIFGTMALNTIPIYVFYIIIFSEIKFLITFFQGLPLSLNIFYDLQHLVEIASNRSFRH